jgi:chlorophyllide a reductase subunit Z
MLQELIESQPVLVRISAAKRLRDSAEADARASGRSRVQADRLSELFGWSKERQTA